SSFSSSLPPRHLHSFPTRRSSDLDLLVHARHRGDDGRPHVLQILRERVDRLGVESSPPRAGSSTPPSARGCATAAAARGSCRLRDRKSTRLNSSHLGISYAVFCLK